jgi:hypothetical protein
MPYPGFNDLASFTPTQQQQVQQFVSYLQAWLSKQHKDGGEHGAITADSIVTTGDATIGGDGTFGGDVIADFGSGFESGIGQLRTVDGTTLVTGEVIRSGLLLGGVSAGYFFLKKAKPAVFAGGGNFALAIYDLTNTNTVMLQMALDAGNYSLIDGGAASTRINLGNLTRPMLAVYADSFIDAKGALGAWNAVAYNAANFTASAGTWTVDVGDQLEYTYSIINKKMTLRYSLNATDVSNAGVTLKLAIPGGFTSAARVQFGLGVAADNGGARAVALVEVPSGGTVVNLYATLAAGGFAITAADNTAVFGTITFEVQ